MKKTITIFILLLMLSVNSQAQSKKIINDYTTLLQQLTEIKSTAEQEAIDIKKTWYTGQNEDSDAKTSKTDTHVPKADSVEKTTATTIQAQEVKKTAIQNITAEVKKAGEAINSTDKSTSEAVKSTTGMKTVTNDPMKHTKDSLYLEGQKKYEKLQSSVKGVVAKFQVIIRKPKLINDQYKADIKADIVQLNAKLQDFQNVYYGGTMILLKGPKFAINGSVIGDILELGIELYKQISKMVADGREKTAQDFEKACALELWADL